MQYEDLLKVVEQKLQRKVKSRGDFDYLSKKIQETVHESLSPNTLMRLWGYREHVNARESTLDILARFVGYEDYTHFEAERRRMQEEQRNQETGKEAEEEARPKSSPFYRKKWALLALLALVIGVAAYFVFIKTDKGSEEKAEPVLLKSVSELRNDRQYLIHTRDMRRGSLGIDSPELATTCPNSIYHHCDTASAFAIIKYEGNYFLYSTVSKRFIGISTFESDDPLYHNCCAIDITMEQGHFVFNFWYDRSLNKVATLNVNWKIGVVITAWGAYNNVFDNGNLFSIEDAGPFDPTEALEKLRQSAEKHKDDVWHPDSLIWEQIEFSDAPLPMGKRRPPVQV